MIVIFQNLIYKNILNLNLNVMICLNDYIATNSLNKMVDSKWRENKIFKNQTATSVDLNTG